MNTTVIIPAAGNGDRWNNYLGTVKHLAPVGGNGEPNIVRTLRLLREMGVFNIYVITHEPTLISAVEPLAGVLRPEQYRYLSDTILSSRNEWGEKTAIVLGDVYFSLACLEKMLRFEKQVCFWGVEPGSSVVSGGLKRGEIYGMTFDGSMNSTVETILRRNSALSAIRDRGLFLFRSMSMGRKVFCQVFRQNYSPKAPPSLRKRGVKGHCFWKFYHALEGKKPHVAWRYGKLWGLYLMISDMDPFGGEEYGWPAVPKTLFSQVEDITQDIDVPEDHRKLLATLEGSVNEAVQQAFSSQPKDYLTAELS